MLKSVIIKVLHNLLAKPHEQGLGLRHATPHKSNKASWPLQVNQRLREALLIVLSAVALYFLLSLLTYDHGDPGWSHTSSSAHAVLNAGGRIGAWFSDVFLYLFGYFAYLFPLVILYTSCLLFRGMGDVPLASLPLLAFRFVGFLLTLAAGTGLAALHFKNFGGHYPYGAGGVLGGLIGDGLVSGLNFQGATLSLLALFLTGVTLATGLSWLSLMDQLGRLLLTQGRCLGHQCANVFSRWQAWRQRKRSVSNEPDTVRKKPPLVIQRKRIEPTLVSKPVINAIAKPLQAKVKSVSKKTAPATHGGFPSSALLEASMKQGKQATQADLEDMSRQVEAKLADFGVNIIVTAVHPGPVITRFELQLAPGIKVSKISGLAKDLARSLAVMSVRVVEIIPGRPVVGLELPNKQRQIVSLHDIIDSPHYEQSTSALSLALGVDISGQPVVVDLAKMPHLLVAGTTGSGKSVALNAMLLSILFKAQPSDVRMILIDPKMLELSVYDHIPHLLTPVVTDMKDAANTLKWCVAEMDRRYELMAALGVRNMASYNRKVVEAIKNNEPLFPPDKKASDKMALAQDEPPAALEPFPYIVVLVDEFADMMMVVGKQVEELIARIAQKARAAGIHLILATQRPSVDVITGLIKANVPSRIAFQVASRIDSRTILDQAGAEQLLGQGDMLYLPIGAGLPTRIHGAFVTDQEVHRVVTDWRSRGAPDYVEEVLTGNAGSDSGFAGPDNDGEGDPLYDDAVRVVTETRRASISMVQRRLKIGYNRAARLVEQMEAVGVVTAMQSNGTREVLAPPPPED